jgi:hypothetical protein
MNLDDARRRTLGSAFGNDSLTYGTLPQWMPDQQVAWRTAAAELSFMVAPFGAVDGSGLSSQSGFHGCERWLSRNGPMHDNEVRRAAAL